MGPTKIKTFVGIIFLFVWITFLILIKSLKGTAPILLFYLNIPIFFIWLIPFLLFGFTTTTISCLFSMLFFSDGINIFPIISFILISFIAHRLNKISESKVKTLEVEIEKVDEGLNLLSEKIEYEKRDNLRMRNSLARTYYLKNIVENYSLVLSKEDVLDSIIKNCFELFENADRILLYLVNTEKQELMLTRSRKREVTFPIKAKQGDIFDRWVLTHRQVLIVEDIHKDFRFSLKEEIDKGFNSIISAPLISEHRIIGILRVDSIEKSKFTQSDLRFLNIIADLSSVSLQNAILYKNVENLAIHDSLTGLYIHKYFAERFQNEVKRSLRNNIDISLLMLDLDDFKAYNDKYGHNAGDLILKCVSSILSSFSRPGDIVSRYGGEEFAFLLLNTDKKASVELAEKIRKKVEETPLVLRREQTHITVSIGIASFPSETRIAEDFLKLADARLYRAKKEGKNRVWEK